MNKIKYFKSEPRGYGSFFKEENGTWSVVQLLESRVNIEFASRPQFQIGAQFLSTETEYNNARAVALLRLGLRDELAAYDGMIAAYEEQEANTVFAGKYQPHQTAHTCMEAGMMQGFIAQVHKPAPATITLASGRVIENDLPF